MSERVHDPRHGGAGRRCGAHQDRKARISANLSALEERIARACDAAGRSRTELTVIAVTKTYPATDVRLLAELGVSDIGENRDQEASAKAAECADLNVTWHFVGQLQTNKAASVAAYADVVHAVDRPRLVQALSRAADRRGRELDCLVQVALDNRTGRGGVPPAEVAGLARAVADADGLRLAGVMAVAPLGGDAMAAFARLAEVARDVHKAHPGATVISAGMTGDLEQAIANGATHLRVGTALLGHRRTFVR